MSANRETRRVLAHFAARQRPIRHVSWPTLLLSFCGFLALAIQSFVVQTHIHRLILSPAASINVALDGEKNSPVAQESRGAAPRRPTDRYPLEGDPANCPICQEIAHAGAVLHSTTISVALAVSSPTPRTFVRESDCFTSAVTHTWRGRAPPCSEIRL